MAGHGSWFAIFYALVTGSREHMLGTRCSGPTIGLADVLVLEVQEQTVEAASGGSGCVASSGVVFSWMSPFGVAVTTSLSLLFPPLYPCHKSWWILLRDSELR